MQVALLVEGNSSMTFRPIARILGLGVVFVLGPIGCGQKLASMKEDKLTV